MSKVYMHIGWILFGALQYGYHISALNAAQEVMTCSTPDGRRTTSLWDCVPMTDAQFGIVTASYTLGGLIGSFFSENFVSWYGKKKTMFYAAVAIALGDVIMVFSTSIPMLFLGRSIIGVGCGINLCCVPIALATVAPPSIKGLIGVTNQLSICTGILVAQAFSSSSAKLLLWRLIPVLSGGIALFQIITSAVWNENHKTSDTSRERSSQEPLLENEDETNEIENNESNNERQRISKMGLLTSTNPLLQRSVVLLFLAQITQQVSGINAVIYYSTSIMSKVAPDTAKYLALFITVVNLVSTFPTAFLIDRIGRRPLLLASGYIMCVCHALLAYAINESHAVFASINIVTIVIGFSIGLGPIPFILIGDIFPPEAADSAASLGLSANWISNFIVAALFLPIRNLLSGEDGLREGNVFVVFAILVGGATVVISRLLRSG